MKTLSRRLYVLRKFAFIFIYNQLIILERIILGIDPGTNIMGYGLIQQNGNKIQLITMGVLKLTKYDNHALKLKKISNEHLELLKNLIPMN
jgi:crossover junction endodeoxyribonuclease RuvC